MTSWRKSWGIIIILIMMMTRADWDRGALEVGARVQQLVARESGQGGLNVLKEGGKIIIIIIFVIIIVIKFSSIVIKSRRMRRSSPPDSSLSSTPIVIIVITMVIKLS